MGRKHNWVGRRNNQLGEQCIAWGKNIGLGGKIQKFGESTIFPHSMEISINRAGILLLYPLDIPYIQPVKSP
jgi:hypothetical protein